MKADLVQPMAIEAFTALLEGASPFSFSRWNDGQWRMVLGKVDGGTGDGHKYAKVIGDDLRAVLLDRPEYIIGLQGLSTRGNLGKVVKAWLQETGLENLLWVNADVFHHASRDNTIGPLVQQLVDREVVVVGPEHMKRLPFTSHFVSIPQTDAYYERHRIIDQVADLLGGDPLVVSVSAGWTANLLISELYPSFGDKHTFIDFGSVWDPYVGVYSRGYMNKGNFKCDLMIP